MDQSSQAPLKHRNSGEKDPLGFRDVLQELFEHANQGYSRFEVLRRIALSLIRFCGVDLLRIRMDEGGKTTRSQASLAADGTVQVQVAAPGSDEPVTERGEKLESQIPTPVLRAVLGGNLAAPADSFTRGRSFWTGDSARPILLEEMVDGVAQRRTVVIGGEFPSLALLPIPASGQSWGVLFLASRRRDHFTRDDIQVYEVMVQALGAALLHHEAQWALRERVKELTCLYGIHRVGRRPGIRLEELLGEVVNLLPPGWQYPEITSGRIVLDGNSFVTENFKVSPSRQVANIFVDERRRGFVEVSYQEEMPEIDEGPFLNEERNLINAIAETIGRLVGHHETQSALRERVKELTCLYGIAKVARRPGIQVDEFLREVVDLLPPGWQYPELTEARITLDGRSFATTGFVESPLNQTAGILVDNADRGLVEVVYTKEVPGSEDGPFLHEERSLIDEVARQVGLIVEHWEAEQETQRLQEQLLHAERLATVGQLAAGVAHELNEPLAAIFGFAQLAKDSPSLSEQAGTDIEKVINAALHAREIIRKLLLFTRQMPTRKVECNLSRLVKEGLYILESRCSKEGVSMVQRLDDDMPSIMADPSQMQQVLVNLVVNAIHAMPYGGQLTLTTRYADDKVRLIVEDTGLGMDEKVLKQAFLPFFTTKSVGQGTGLGLAVVHGIVTAHGGTIEARSEVGKGSCFEVCFPPATESNVAEAH